MNNVKTSPLIGISIDSKGAKRIDDMFWVLDRGDDYIVHVFTPIILSNLEFGTDEYSPLGFGVSYPIQALCFQMAVAKNAPTVKFFTVFECWAQNILALSYIDDSVENEQAKEVINFCRKIIHTFPQHESYRPNELYKELALSDVIGRLLLLVNLCATRYAVDRKVVLLCRRFPGLVRPNPLSVGVYARFTCPIRRSIDRFNQTSLLTFLRGIRENKAEPVVRTQSPETSDDKAVTDPALVVAVTLVTVINDDYISALELTFLKLNLPPPNYSFEQKRFGRIWKQICTATCSDSRGCIEIASTDGVSKREAKKYAARKLYLQLAKKYKQKVA